MSKKKTQDPVQTDLTLTTPDPVTPFPVDPVTPDQALAASTPSDPIKVEDQVNEEGVTNLGLAVALLREARRGVLTMLNGSGPYDDRISGVFFRDDNSTFNLSLWDKEVEDFLSRVHDE